MPRDLQVPEPPGLDHLHEPAREALRGRLAGSFVGDSPEVPHQRRGLLLHLAAAQPAADPRHLEADRGAPVLHGLGLANALDLSLWPPNLKTASNATLVFCNENEPLVATQVCIQELGVAAADNVHQQVLSAIQRGQQAVHFGRGHGELWPCLELAQRAIVVQKNGLEALARRSKGCHELLGGGCVLERRGHGCPHSADCAATGRMACSAVAAAAPRGPWVAGPSVGVRAISVAMALLEAHVQSGRRLGVAGHLGVRVALPNIKLSKTKHFHPVQYHRSPTEREERVAKNRVCD
mmetsp:Transcript_58134/g.177130  ORF Transcript_58134/g.177130 Transcript_58134/m.177130 type:complete len:294 (+) Transcript_58134:834-1715(+)